MSGKILQYLIGGLFTLLTISCSEEKDYNPFYVKTYNLTDSLERLDYFVFIHDKQIDTVDNYSDIEFPESPDTLSSIKRLFENPDYLVVGTSMGEFGGSLIFSDKKSDINYFLNCRDPLMVDFKDGYYYVTEQYCGATYGRTRVLKIKDPTSLIRLNDNDLPRGQIQRDSIAHANADFVKELNKEIVLIDTSEVIASIFYPYKGKNYLIYSAMDDLGIQFDEIDTTFLGEIRNGSLVTLDTILNKPTWTTGFVPNRIVNGTYVYNFSVNVWNELAEKFINTKGRIFVMGDTIVIGHRYPTEGNGRL